MSAITLLTLLGASLLFVGGLVLWVYGTETPRAGVVAEGFEAEATRNLHTHLVQWFLLYGGVTSFAGVGCLLTATIMVI